MEQVWEWRSANPEDWQQLTDSFYKAVSSSAVCAVGIINERYKEFRVQLFSDEKNNFAYLLASRYTQCETGGDAVRGVCSEVRY